MWLGGLILKRANFPSSHHREEGWRRHQENGAKPSYGRRRGGVPCPIDRNTTPSSRKTDAAQYFLDRSATPPRRDARRGIGVAHTSSRIGVTQPFRNLLRLSELGRVDRHIRLNLGY